MEAVTTKLNRREPRLPQMEMIRVRAARIRAGWSPIERKQRAETARRQLVQLVNQL